MSINLAMIHAYPSYSNAQQPRTQERPGAEWHAYQQARQAQHARNQVANAYDRQMATARAEELKAQGGQDWRCERCGI
jgi:hypothetical protein